MYEFDPLKATPSAVYRVHNPSIRFRMQKYHRRTKWFTVDEYVINTFDGYFPPGALSIDSNGSLRFRKDYIVVFFAYDSSSAQELLAFLGDIATQFPSKKKSDLSRVIQALPSEKVPAEFVF